VPPIVPGSFGCSIGVAPPSGNPNTGFSIKTTATSSEMQILGLLFIGVVGPSGTYTCGIPTGQCAGVTGANSPTPSCTVPYAVSGSLASSEFSTGCSGSSSTAWVQQSSSVTLADLETYCTSGTGTFGTTPTGSGSTANPGTYTAIACWSEGPGNSYYATTMFSINSLTTSSSSSSSSSSSTTTSTSSSSTTAPVTGVPQFPLFGGIGVLLVLLVPVLLIFRKRLSPPRGPVSI
jgi:hypothetical protein